MAIHLNILIIVGQTGILPTPRWQTLATGTVAVAEVVATEEVVVYRVQQGGLVESATAINVGCAPLETSAGSLTT